MPEFLCFTVRLLDRLFHGRTDGGEPEWPPSPLRLFQALVNTAAVRCHGDPVIPDAESALRWLERQRPPIVVAPQVRFGAKYRLYCPDNIGDRVAASWTRGGEASVADSRTEKDVRPIHLLDGDEIRYLWEMAPGTVVPLGTLRDIAQGMTRLGWGIDIAVGHCETLSLPEAGDFVGERWIPCEQRSAHALRCPVPGTLDGLLARHARFLCRLDRDSCGNEFFNPVPALRQFDVVHYRRDSDLPPRPHAVFLLQADEGSRPFSYPQEKLIHISGMVRHLAIKALDRSPPRDVPADWLETFVAGHGTPADDPHARFSYVPLPSIGHAHADQRIRRILVLAPSGADHWLDHLGRLLSGMTLEPEKNVRMSVPPTLVYVRGDNVARHYLRESRIWASVTPVILPGHDDKSPSKTPKLIEKALRQSGVTQPCEFDWSPFSRFPKSLSAHKYGKDRQPTGYLRPDHLNSQTAVHLTLSFPEPIPGPLVIGAGRHYGFGLMAPPLT